ncbi:MAG TPA: baseplate J/gp47 family protein, partial [Patescibacteria group bacterium]|nr:baseplate J/gp47 family protein [Patescibacteria group bacterium]
MKLPIGSFIGKKGKPQYFLALLLHEEKASAVILEEFQEKVKVIGRHEEYFSSTVEEASEDELLRTLDKAISAAEEKLPPDMQTEKMVLGVKESWVEEKHIKKEYLTKLKKVCEALSLTPVGFLVISEAVAHLIQEEEGAPLSALLCEIGRRHLTVSLFRAGKIIESKTTQIANTNIPVTVDALLKEFSATDILPARVILFNGDTEDLLIQSFVAHQWSKSIPFLHMPQISILPSGFAAKSVVVGAAEQMGFALPGHLVDKTAEEIKTVKSSAPEPEESADEDETEPSSLSKEAKTNVDTVVSDNFTQVANPESPDAFGFVLEEDIVSKRDQKAVNANESEAGDKSFEKEQTKAEVTYAIEPEQQHIPSQSHHSVTMEQDIDHDHHQPAKKDLFAFATSALQIPIAFLNKLPFGHMNPLRALRAGNRLVLIPFLLLILGAGALFLYYFTLGATVDLKITPKDVTQEENITFAVNGNNDYSKNAIAAKEQSATLNGTASTNATGKKEVGEKAKGTVTLYNSAESKVTLEKGTKLKTSNNLEFELEKDISIASASGDIFSGIKSGTGQVAVVAAKIGKEYNLPSDTKFNLGQTTSLAAKNESAFSGGSKKEVTVVSQKDVDKLAADLPKSLKEKADEEFTKQIGEDEVLLSAFTTTTLANKKFNKNVGDEVKSVTLTADVTFDTVSYLKTDMNKFADAIIKERHGDKTDISDKNRQTDIKKAERDEDDKDTIQAAIVINAGLLPKLD